MSIKTLKINYKLYASKKYKGNNILKYTKKSEKNSGDKCLLNNSGWFGNLEVAKSYKTKNTKIYRWKIKSSTNLFKINYKNEEFINYIFKNTKKKLEPAII